MDTGKEPWQPPLDDPLASRLDAYDYFLPPELVAQQPVEPRDSSRLMVLERGRPGAAHVRFRHLPLWLKPGDLLVVNETKVFPARLVGRRETGGRVELLLLREEGGIWRALAKPARRVRRGQRLSFPAGLAAEVVEEEVGGVRWVRLHSPRPLAEVLEAAGQVPLPPYIRRQLDDPERYQTVYARETGSVAAPTAGLHFTPELFRALRERGVEVARLVLHVGPGTFRPVEVEDVGRHVMDPETYRIPEETAEAIAAARARGGRVIAVGTTVTRALETAALGEGRVRAGSGWTDLFIRPGFRFQVVEGLITNFHLPRSTLLMLVSAFHGRERTLSAYREAIRMGYRFYSLGDAMFIRPGART